MNSSKRISLLLLIGLIACTPRPKRDALPTDGQSSENRGSVDAPPEENEEKADSFILVCPGGNVRSYAAQGAIEVLEESKIPIHSVIAWGSGALFCGAYAASSSVHEFQWRLQKLNESLFTGENKSRISTWIGKGTGAQKEETLQKIFGDTAFQQSRKPLKIFVPGKGFLSHGPISAAVLEALQNSSAPSDLELSLTSQEQESLRVMVLETENTPSFPHSFRLVPKLDTVPIDDFSKRSSASYQGKVSTRMLLPRIKGALK